MARWQRAERRPGKENKDKYHSIPRHASQDRAISRHHIHGIVCELELCLSACLHALSAGVRAVSVSDGRPCPSRVDVAMRIHVLGAPESACDLMRPRLRHVPAYAGVHIRARAHGAVHERYRLNALLLSVRRRRNQTSRK
jgi:hypothetical protein